MLGVGITVVALLVALRPLVLFFVLLRTQLQRPSYTPIVVEDVPEDVRDYLRRGAEPLLALGFTEHAWRRQTSLEWSRHGVRPMLLLEHTESGACADISPAITGALLRVNFFAELDDGSWLETAHGETQLLIGPLPDTELVDTTDPDPCALWQRFHARLTEVRQERAVVRRTAEDAAATAELRMSRIVDSWLAGGVLQHAREPGRFELRVRHAAKLAVRFASKQSALAKLQAQMKQRQPAPPLVEQIRGYRRIREVLEQRSNRFHVGVVLLVSAGVFAITMLRLVEPSKVIALVAVVLFHELGHYGAMRVLGYEGTSIFFIPFFGAAARGTKPDERAYEKLIVLLAGPLPGIALGALLPWALPSLRVYGWFEWLVDLLLVINLLNLLPIFPLDGGRIVQVIFSNARPLFEVGFRAFGAFALLGLGVASSDAVLIALGVMLLLGIPAVRRTARAVRNIRARGPVPAQEEQRIALVFSELTSNQPSLPPAQRFAVVMPVAERLRHGELGVFGSLLWSAVYVGSVAAGLTGIFFATVGQAYAKPELVALACDDVDVLRDRIPAGPGQYSFECKSDEAHARAVVEDIRSMLLGPLARCLRAPWHPQALTADQLRARRTVGALQRAQEDALRDYYDALEEEGADERPSAQQVAEEKRRYSLALQQGAAARQAWLAKHANDADVDAEVANAYLAIADDEKLDQADPRTAFLLDRLGRRPEGCAAPSPIEGTGAWQEPRSGTAHVVAHDADARTQGPELARYLCERGCNLRYWHRPTKPVSSRHGR